MTIVKNVINSIQDNLFLCVQHLQYSNDDLVEKVKEYENKLSINQEKRVDHILYETGLITDEIAELQYGVAYNLQMIELLFLLTYRKIIDSYDISQDDFDAAYPEMYDMAVFFEKFDKQEIVKFIMLSYSIFYSEVLCKASFKEALINVHRFYISFK